MQHTTLSSFRLGFAVIFLTAFLLSACGEQRSNSLTAQAAEPEPSPVQREQPEPQTSPAEPTPEPTPNPEPPQPEPQPEPHAPSPEPAPPARSQNITVLVEDTNPGTVLNLGLDASAQLTIAGAIYPDCEPNQDCDDGFTVLPLQLLRAEIDDPSVVEITTTTNPTAEHLQSDFSFESKLSTVEVKALSVGQTTLHLTVENWENPGNPIEREVALGVAPVEAASLRYAYESECSQGHSFLWTDKLPFFMNLYGSNLGQMPLLGWNDALLRTNHPTEILAPDGYFALRAFTPENATADPFTLELTEDIAHFTTSGALDALNYPMLSISQVDAFTLPNLDQTLADGEVWRLNDAYVVEAGRTAGTFLGLQASSRPLCTTMRPEIKVLTPDFCQVRYTIASFARMTNGAALDIRASGPGVCTFEIHQPDANQGEGITAVIEWPFR